MTTWERVYTLLSDDDEESNLCSDLPPEACQEAPRNFLLNAANGAVTKLGDELGSPSLVLPWLLEAIGAPTFLTGWLVPVRRALALLPQMVIAGQIREFEQRKWFWAGGGAAFGLVFLLMIPAALWLSPLAAGITIVLLLAAGSVGRGVSSVAFKDVLAKTIAEGRRGRLLATRSAVAGILTLGAGMVLRLYVGEESDLTPYLLLLATAGGLWFVGAGLAAAVTEVPGVTGDARNAVEEARAGWALLQRQPGFRRFILARILLLSVPLSLPYFVLYFRQFTGAAVAGLSVLVVARGLAEVVSSPFWGRFSDRSSRGVMAAGGGLALVTGGVALLLGRFAGGWYSSLVAAVLFFVLGVAGAGVRLGRKTYLVDAAPAAERPLYVALTNTLVGAITLASGFLGLIAEFWTVQALLLTFLAFMAGGITLAWRMPEADGMAQE
ncbi:MAG: MFS transporter [Anaerolineae bacterium]|nr:MFS transporter [Anaerolineae bacterium]